MRVKRRGKQAFNSQDVGAASAAELQHIESARVNLTRPQVTVNLEIEDDKLMLVKRASSKKASAVTRSALRKT